MQFCKAKETPHPSFVILDTPLRAYREPEGHDDDLSGTDVDVKFYEQLSGLGDDRQVIVVENRDPPTPFVNRPQVTMFSLNPNSGRYGFFPVAPVKPAAARPGNAEGGPASSNVTYLVQLRDHGVEERVIASIAQKNLRGTLDQRRTDSARDSEVQ